MTEADIPEMMALRLSMRENRLLDPSQLTTEDCRRYVMRGHMWVWDEGGAIHGISAGTSISDGSGAVRPSSREGRGVGRALFAAACDALIAADFRTLRLSTAARSIARRAGARRGVRRTAN